MPAGRTGRRRRSAGGCSSAPDSAGIAKLVARETVAALLADAREVRLTVRGPVVDLVEELGHVCQVVCAAVGSRGLATRKAELTDAQWAAIEPLTPRVSGRSRSRRDHRQVVEGIVHRDRCGIRGGIRPSGSGRGRQATRFDEHALSYRGAVVLAAVLTWTRAQEARLATSP